MCSQFVSKGPLEGGLGRVESDLMCTSLCFELRLMRLAKQILLLDKVRLTRGELVVQPLLRRLELGLLSLQALFKFAYSSLEAEDSLFPVQLQLGGRTSKSFLHVAHGRHLVLGQLGDLVIQLRLPFFHSRCLFTFRFLNRLLCSDQRLVEDPLFFTKFDYGDRTAFKLRAQLFHCRSPPSKLLREGSEFSSLLLCVRLGIRQVCAQSISLSVNFCRHIGLNLLELRIGTLRVGRGCCYPS
mmetsp:Transcript_7920/g.20162  ORF Transcript_7920/g.20162 Transcript_7920/m.20162 type:complete len:241 (-) Transcript_7920:214-936(-)